MNEKQKIFLIIYAIIIIALWIYCMELAEQALTRIYK